MSSRERGQVWMVDLGYVAKYRPRLVLSILPLESDRALTTVIPHKTSPRGTRFEVAVDVPYLKPGVFDAQNAVTTAKAKFTRKLGSLTKDQLGSVEDAVRHWLGL
jgi:mRNA interferase MazF